MTARPAGSARHWMRLGAAFLAFSAQSGLPTVTFPPLPPELPFRSIDLGLGQPTGTYSIRLPTNVEAERCHLDLYQAGAFGGMSGVISPKIERNILIVPTGAQGKPAQRLKAILWCPGYAIALIDEPALERSKGEIELALRPLANVEINAKVLPAPNGQTPTGDEVRVSYDGYWLCGFFALSECFMSGWTVTTATIGDDGSLRFAVPNFAADPVVASSSFPGGFRLDAVGSYSLVADGFASGSTHTIPVMRNYPPNIVLRPRPR